MDEATGIMGKDITEEVIPLDKKTIVVLEGDQTGQELLEESLRILDPEVIGFEIELKKFDLSLENRRNTKNEVVYEAARAMKEAGYGIKAATITPEAKGDVGSPNAILRKEIDGKVIIRTGRRIPGVRPVAGAFAPISVIRMAVGDAYGAKEWREGEGIDEISWRTNPSTGKPAAPWPNTPSATPNGPMPRFSVVPNTPSVLSMKEC